MEVATRERRPALGVYVFFGGIDVVCEHLEGIFFVGRVVPAVDYCENICSDIVCRNQGISLFVVVVNDVDKSIGLAGTALIAG